MDASTYVQNMYVVRGGINGGTKAIIVFDGSVQEAKESRSLKAREVFLQDINHIVEAICRCTCRFTFIVPRQIDLYANALVLYHHTDGIQAKLH